MENLHMVYPCIFSYIDIPQLNKFLQHPIDRMTKKSIDDIMNFTKKNNNLYTCMLSKLLSESEITKMPCILFDLKFLKTNFRDFRAYIFFVCEKISSNHKQFYLVSKLYKYYYVKYIDKNNILLIFDITDNNIYYTIFQKRVVFSSDRDISLNHMDNIISFPPSGYLKFDGKITSNYQHVVSLIE